MISTGAGKWCTDSDECDICMI